jgi:hypothetical protein
MLVTDQNRLRWCGIDMRPLARRRAATALTYLLFLLTVWVYPNRLLPVMQILFIGTMIVTGIVPTVVDMFSTKTKRILVPGLFLLALAMIAVASASGLIAWFFLHPGKVVPSTSMSICYALFLIRFYSVLTPGKLVDTGYRGIGYMIRNSRGSSRIQRRLARSGFAIGLDGFAWYEYSVRFKKLTAEQQEEIAQLHRANPHGKWMRQYGPLFDDERMRHEEDRLRAQVQRILVWVLVVSAIIWSLLDGLSDFHPSSYHVGAWVWTLVLLATTLRQGIVLWTEPDELGELTLVESNALRY